MPGQSEFTPQRDPNTVTFHMVEAAKDFLAAHDNQSFDIARNAQGLVTTLDPEKHPRNARSLLDAMNKAANGGEFAPSIVMKLVIDDADEAGRDVNRTKLAGQSIYNISAVLR